jgi:hypothetical protein
MTQETFNQLKTFKHIWEFYYSNFYVTANHDLNGLAEWLKTNTGFSTDMSCNACKEQVIRMGRNLYEENEKQYGTQSEQESPKKRRGSKA